MAKVTEHDMVSVYLATSPETRQSHVIDSKPEADVCGLLCLGEVESTSIL